MKNKIAKATEIQLDFLVASLEYPGITVEEFLFEYDRGCVDGEYRYSTDGRIGVEIIEREITTFSHDDNSSTVYVWHKDGVHRAWDSGGHILVAAMRCYVASKLGDEVEIPDELK